jgi:hypothetical protein
MLRTITLVQQAGNRTNRETQTQTAARCNCGQGKARLEDIRRQACSALKAMPHPCFRWLPQSSPSRYDLHQAPAQRGRIARHCAAAARSSRARGPGPTTSADITKRYDSWTRRGTDKGLHIDRGHSPRIHGVRSPAGWGPAFGRCAQPQEPA